MDTLLDGRKKIFFEKLEMMIGEAAVLHPTIVAIHNSQWIDSFSCRRDLHSFREKRRHPPFFFSARDENPK